MKVHFENSSEAEYVTPTPRSRNGHAWPGRYGTEWEMKRRTDQQLPQPFLMVTVCRHNAQETAIWAMVDLVGGPRVR